MTVLAKKTSSNGKQELGLTLSAGECLMSENMLDFQCPHCRANHQLPVEFAGNRQPCSECGQTMRLPSKVGNAASPMATSVNQTRSGSIMVTCPLCSKTLYASQQQIGEEILCETCLESIPVPTPDKQNRTIRTSNPPATQTSNPTHKNSPNPESDTEQFLQTSPANQGNELNLAPEVESLPFKGEKESRARKNEALKSPSPIPLEPKPASTSPPQSPIQAIPVEPALPDSPAEEDEEIIELEAVGEAQSIPVQPWQPINSISAEMAETTSEVKYELVIRWGMLCPACQSQLIVYQQDVGQTVQCEKCNQPVTVELRTPLPRPERVAKVSHQFIGRETRVAVLSKNQPNPKKETIYKTVIEWQIECNVCGTGITATPEDVGSQKKCPDCFKMHTVVAPVKIPEPIKRAVRDELEELSNTQTPASSKQVLSEIPDMREKLQRDEYATSRKILERARQQQAEKNEQEQASSKNNNHWLNSMTQLFASPTTLARITLLTIGYAFTAAFFSLSLNTFTDNSNSAATSSQDTKPTSKTEVAEEIDLKEALQSPASSIKAVGGVLLFVAALTMFMFINLTGLPTLMNILRQTTVGDMPISYWPAFSIVNAFSDALIVFCGIIYSLIPAGILFSLLNLIFAEPFLPAILSSITSVILFPFFVMNILASGSVMRPLSNTLAKRLQYQGDLITKFLFSALIVVIIHVTGISLLAKKSLILAMLGGALVWIGYVLLARLVGFLVFNLNSDHD